MMSKKPKPKPKPEPNEDDVTKPRGKGGCGQCDEGWTGDGEKWVKCPNC